jgi:hypothetical protein
MAHFIGRLKGQKGESSRLGSKQSGFVSYVHGWNLGVKIIARHDKDKQKDVFQVYKTSGSNATFRDVLIGTFEEV